MTTPIPTARDIMSGSVHTIAPDESLEAAVRLLLKRGHSGAPVVDAKGAILGVLSEHDCLRALAAAAVSGWPTGSVADHATPEVDAVAPADDVLALAARFAQGGHRRLLVVENGRLVGIVSRRDLLRALAPLAGQGSGRGRSTYDLIEERRRRLD